MVTSADGRVSEFQEKPRRPRSIPSDPARAYVSMGNYLFKPKLLAAVLPESSRRGETDFGVHLLPRLVRTNRVVAYDFAMNRVPGVQPCEEPAYWRDVGTLEAYRKAQRDVVGPAPRFNLWNPGWPLRDAGCGRLAEGYGERRICTADLAQDELSCVDVS